MHSLSDTIIGNEKLNFRKRTTKKLVDETEKHNQKQKRFHETGLNENSYWIVQYKNKIVFP